jgi:hypothetical protein
MYDVTSAFINTSQPELARTMRGGGRVLAFYTHGSHRHNISRGELDAIGSGDCVVFSDKHHPDMLSIDELEFIRDITGATKEHMIVLGSGNPDTITEKFSAIDDMLGKRRQVQSLSQDTPPT